MLKDKKDYELHYGAYRLGPGQEPPHLSGKDDVWHVTVDGNNHVTRVTDVHVKTRFEGDGISTTIEITAVVSELMLQRHARND